MATLSNPTFQIDTITGMPYDYLVSGTVTVGLTPFEIPFIQMRFPLQLQSTISADNTSFLALTDGSSPSGYGSNNDLSFSYTTQNSAPETYTVNATANAIVPQNKMKEVQDEKLFPELDNEVAASSRRNVAYLYENDNFQGERLPFADGAFYLHTWKFDNKTSSIQIEGNAQWAFYPDTWFKGNPVIIGSGNYTSTQLEQLGILNDSISSLRRVGGPYG